MAAKKKTTRKPAKPTTVKPMDAKGPDVIAKGPDSAGPPVPDSTPLTGNGGQDYIADAVGAAVADADVDVPNLQELESRLADAVLKKLEGKLSDGSLKIPHINAGEQKIGLEFPVKRAEDAPDAFRIPPELMDPLLHYRHCRRDKLMFKYQLGYRPVKYADFIPKGSDYDGIYVRTPEGWVQNGDQILCEIAQDKWRKEVRKRELLNERVSSTIKEKFHRAGESIGMGTYEVQHGKTLE